METINNLTAAATKAVWGENESANKEPVSGVKGDTAHGEPYDAGNLATPQQEKAADNYGRHGEERETGLGREAPVSKSTETTTTTTTPGAGAATAPVPAPNTQAKDTSAGQNDTRAPEQADKGNKDLHDVDDTSEGTDVKLGDGPGPQPIDKLAKEYGGDAGNAPVEGTSHKPTEAGSGGTTESSKSENQPHDPKEDEYITASGFAADGGDFDASKPGAGREADRLLEQKGVHLGEGGSSNPSHTESHSSGKHHDEKHEKHDEKKDKPSIGERIKAKLHKH